MKKGIENLAYLINEAKKNNEPKPIVFLGAGASVSGGIPLAGGIIKKILKDFEDNPAIINLPKDKKGDYYELMSALTPKQRKALFQEYIKNAKVNIAYIYLAQLIEEGYVDYVLTVNFDDLLLRACGLFNYSIPTYDISNITNYTTTTYQKKSIIYLHGQHYGEFLLNSKIDLKKIKPKISPLFDSIKDERTWIIVGYSGEDEVFDCLKKYSSFDHELYWVGYLNYEPSKNVMSNLLSIEEKNTHLISGYDADTFFLDLHAKLGLETPKIMNKPFSFLQDMMKEIKEPEQKNIIEEHKELYKGVSERMKITNKWIDKAIEQIENNDSIEKFKQKIIDAIIKGDFNDKLAESFEDTIIQKNYEDAKETLSEYYDNWGVFIFKKIIINSKQQQQYKQSIKKFEKAIELNKKNVNAFYNFGTLILNYAKKFSDKKSFENSFEIFKKGIQLNPKDIQMHINLGIAFTDLAKLTGNEVLIENSFKQYEKALKIDKNSADTYYNYGVSLSFLAELREDETLFKNCFDKYKKASELNNTSINVYEGWSGALLNFYQLKKSQKNIDQLILNDAKEKAILSNKYFGIVYNLSCVYALLNEKENALNYLKEALNKKQVPIKHILGDKDWKHYLEDDDFKILMNNY